MAYPHAQQFAVSNQNDPRAVDLGELPGEGVRRGSPNQLARRSVGSPPVVVPLAPVASRPSAVPVPDRRGVWMRCAAAAAAGRERGEGGGNGLSRQ